MDRSNLFVLYCNNFDGKTAILVDFHTYFFVSMFFPSVVVIGLRMFYVF